MRWILSVFLALVLVGCAPQSISTAHSTPTSLPSTANEARNTLINFLTMLHTKKYADAVPLYGGDYEELKLFNPEIDSADHAALWTWACDNQLLQCLEVHSATFQQLVGELVHLSGRI